MTEQFSLLELTENLSKEIIYCDRLIFLCKFREFYQLMNSKDGSENRSDNLKQAGKLIVQLLDAPKLVPFKYLKRIMYELRSLVKEVTNFLLLCFQLVFILIYFIFSKNAFNEEQLFSLLRIIQSNENRRNIFKEGQKFNLRKLAENYSQNDFSMPIEEDPIEIEYKFDTKSWHDFLNEMSTKLADCFLNNSVETDGVLY